MNLWHEFFDLNQTFILFVYGQVFFVLGLAIADEALSNVVRHAHARRVWVTAERRNGQLEVRVTDDGVGLSGEDTAGFGLRNMRDRTRLLGGTLRIERNPPRGTQVVLSVPWDDPR
jgi:signal transduction histidine kinase